MKTEYQTIVIGAGAIGSATAYQLGLSGQRDVLVLEQFSLGHPYGASEDHSRIIRHSYHHNDYGRLTRSMYDAWQRLEEASGQQLFIRTGGLDIAVEGTPGEESLNTYRAVMAANGVPFETLDRAKLIERFPQWSINEDRIQATYQEESGIIDIRRARQVHTAMAEGLGVTFLDNTPARAVESTTAGARVVTDNAVYTAQRVVLCTASWTDRLLGRLGQTWSMTISQEQVMYLATAHLKDFAVGNFPVWAWHGQDLFYGFPVYGEAAIKVARDMTGRFVTQETRSYEPSEEESARLRKFIQHRLPLGIGRELYSKTCIYDMPPDRNFVLDFVPGHPNILLGIGAGHAGKFAALVGEILAGLAITGRSSHPVKAFRADRHALVDAAYTPAFSLQK